MPINANVSGQPQITATVGETKIDVSVSGGVGPSGPAGPAGATDYTQLTNVPATFPPSQHGHTIAEVSGLQAALDGKQAAGSYATLVGGKVPESQLPPIVTTWDGLTGKPSTFPPSAHTHDDRYYTEAEVDTLLAGKQPAGSYAASVHTHTASQISDFTTAAAAAAPVQSVNGQTGVVTIASYSLPTATASVLGGVKIGSGISIDGNGVISASSGYTLPVATDSVLGGVKIGSGVTITDGVISVSTNYAAASHTHAIADVTGLQTALDGKQASGSYAAAVHTHGISDVTGLQTALDGKAATSHTHTVSAITDAGTAATRNVPASGNASSTEVVLGSDTRLSDQRVPTDGSVTTAKIADSAVTAVKVANGTLTWAKFASSQIITPLTVVGGAGGISTTGAISQRAVFTDAVQFSVSTFGVVTVGQWQATAIAVAFGGTGATDAATARTNLGVAYGSTAGTVCQGNDARLTDSRTPTAHKASHATGGTDALTPSDIGAAALSHTHSVGDITATGTPSASTFLRGDGTWAAPGGSSVAVQSDTVGSTSYIGRAAAGSANSASVWTIRRAIFTSAGAVSSTATATNVAWDNRLTATYS